MKINDINRLGSVNPYRNNTNPKAAGSAQKKEKLKDEVQISSQAKELLDAEAASAMDPRRQKIQGLKQSISSGTYYVEAGKIAEKLLPFMK